MLACLIIIVIIVIIFVLWRRNSIEHMYSNDKICICMYYTDDIKSYSDLIADINQRYAIKHGYGFVSFSGRVSDRYPTWDKLFYTLALLLEGKYDYIFWIDSDAFFNMHDKKIQDVIDIKSDYDLHICSDVPNSAGLCRVNTGTYLIKNTDWSIDLISRIWDHPFTNHYSQNKYHEQTILDYLIKYNPKVSVKTKIYPARKFNSVYLVSVLKLNNNDYIIHLMGRSAEERIDAANAWYTRNTSKY